MKDQAERAFGFATALYALDIESEKRGKQVDVDVLSAVMVVGAKVYGLKLLIEAVDRVAHECGAPAEREPLPG